MKEKKFYVIIGMISGIALIIILNFGFKVLTSGLGFNLLGQSTEKTSTLKDHQSLSIDDKLSKINDLLNLNYIDAYEDRREYLADRMYREMLQDLGDPYTVYMDKTQFSQFMEDTEGVYAGIGVVVSPSKDDNLIEIVSAFEGAPGAKAGILPGDKIIKVNGSDVYGHMLNEVVKNMKGEPGTSVSLTISREDTGETLNLDLVREKIDIPTVSHKMLENDIGYLKINQFDGVTYEQYLTAFKDLERNNMRGLILDLRGNPGGVLDSVAKITDTLVPEGIIMYTEDKQGDKQYIYSDRNCIKIPLVVLIDGGSASASEVLTGAVKDHGIATLVGTTTYGKGIVQKIFELPDKSAVKITISKYFSPNGVCIHEVGITPDYVVEMKEELSVKISSLTSEEDIQLKKALEVMELKLADKTAPSA